MAAKDGAPPQHLIFLRNAVRQVRRFGLFPMVRGAEARAPGKPRVGRSRRPAQNLVDLHQVPTLSFPDSTLREVEFDAGRAHIGGYWFGLTGPMGPLPSHMTEFAAFERRYAKSRPFGDWLDVLAGRMLQLFYRAWGDSQPAAQADRPDDDGFAKKLAQLSGATEGVGRYAAFPAINRIHYAALFASRRSAGAIEDAIRHLLGLDVKIQEYRAFWRDVDAADQTRLGRSYCALGTEAMAGGRVRIVSDAFRIVARAASLAEYESLLPAGHRFKVLSEALQAFAPGHLDWDVALEISGRHLREARLDGRSQLGWTGWLGKVADDELRTDTHLRRTKKRFKGSDTAPPPAPEPPVTEPGLPAG